MKTLNRRNKIFLRTFSLTAFMIVCAVTVVFSSAYIVTVVEKNAYGKTVEIFSFDDNSFTLLGQKVNIPLAAIASKTKIVLEKYSLGTVKLLGMAVTAVEELILKIIQMF